MERKILFKAKRLDTKEWVHGFLVPNRMSEGMSIEVFNYKNEWCGAYFVDPSTVCQYTGLKDKEGKEIWEGDVVEKTYFGSNGNSRVYKGIIVYEDCAFLFEPINDDCLMTGILYDDVGKYIKVLHSKFDKEDKG